MFRLNKLFLLFLFSVGLFAKPISIYDLAFIVQSKEKVKIVVSNSVSRDLIVDYPSDLTGSYMDYFKSVLVANELNINRVGSSFVVSTIVKTDSIQDNKLIAPPPLVSSSINRPINDNNFLSTPIIEDFKLITYRLNYLPFDSIKSFLDFSGIPYSYDKNSKTVIFKYTKQLKNNVTRTLETLKDLDTKKDQVTLKITVFDTNENMVVNTGLENTPISFDLSLLSQKTALLTGSATSKFKMTLNALNGMGASNVSQSTSYLISDGDKLEFKKVVSIPFLDEDFSLSTDVGTNQSKKFKYKDIGFILNATPIIVGDIVHLNFSLSYGTVLSQGDLPTTSENSIVNNFSVTKGDIVLLAGISKDSIIQNDDKNSLIGDIPFLSSIFTHKTKNKSKEFFNVSIEIL